MTGRVAAWVFDNVPLPGWLAPYVFGLIIGRWPRKIRDTTKNPGRREQ